MYGIEWLCEHIGIVSKDQSHACMSRENSIRRGDVQMRNLPPWLGSFSETNGDQRKPSPRDRFGSVSRQMYIDKIQT